jgi:transcriptional regulator with XRE-family HTH domain
MSILVAFGRTLRRERAIRGLSQERLAARAGISPQHVSSIERAQKDVRLNTLIRLAEALDLSVSDLLRGAEDARAVDRRDDES